MNSAALWAAIVKDVRQMRSGFKTILWTAAIALMAGVVFGCLSNRSSDRRPGIETVSSPRPVLNTVAHMTESSVRTRSQISRTVPKVHRSPEVIREKIAWKEATLARGDREESKGGPASGPDEARRQRRMARLDDDGEIKPNALMDAKAHSDLMPIVEVPDEDPLSDGGIWNWEWAGPGNIGGRIRTVCFRDASVIFIGSAGGGIWRSLNGGAGWTPINDFLPSLAITSIIIDPNDITRMYAATGEGLAGDGLPGAGIFRSNTGGATWSQLPATAGWTFSNRLEHHPAQSNVLFAASSSGLWKSIDGGDNWTLLLTGTFLDVKIDPLNPNRVLAGTRSAVFLSTDDGDPGTWTLESTGGSGKLPIAGRCEVTFGALGFMWVSIDRNFGEVWRSTDAGTTWTRRHTGSQYMMTGGGRSQGSYDNAIWASPDDRNLVVVGGINLWRSTDGGVNFTRISETREFHPDGRSAHSDQHMIAAVPGYGSRNRRVYFCNDGGIQTATDIYTVELTSGWTNLANNLGITQFYGGAAHPSGDYMLGGNQDNSTVRYRAEDGPQNWHFPFTGDGGACAINPDDAALQFAEWQRLNFMKSTNFGQTFARATTGLDDAGIRSKTLFIAPFSMDPNNGSTLVAGGTSIWRTTDSAGLWGAIRIVVRGFPKCSAIDIADGNGSLIWVGYNSGLISRTNGNVTTWIDVGNGVPDRFVTDIAINPSNHDEVYVTIGGYATDTVWRTTNGGTTWSQRTGSGENALPAIQVNTIRIHPSNRNWIYVGTDLGVYASQDKGASWSRTPRRGDHEGPANTETAELFWQGDTLVAATHGRGMYRTRPLSVVYVDFSYDGEEEGTFTRPFDSVWEGIDAAGNGTTISIRAATYDEGPITFFKSGRVIATGGLVRIR